MANWKYPRKPTKETTHKKRQQQSQQQQQQQVQKSDKPPPPPPSWTVMKGIFSCRDLQTQQQQQQQKKKDQKQEENKQKKAQKHKKHQEDNNNSSSSKKCKKMRCSVSLCKNNTTTKIVSALPPNLTDLANNGGGGSRSERGRGGSSSGVVVSSSSMVTTTNSFRGMPFSRFSGCYECRMVVDPVLGGFTKIPNSLRSPTIRSCPDCPRIFMNPQSLELHQAVTHAVSELGAEDTSKNIVEIIFQSSWLRKDGGGGGGVAPMCKIDRILKVHNTQSRVSKFEEYRDSIKAKATNFPKKHPRCIADGNELLRFYSANFRCALGLNGSSNLCCSAESVDGGGGCCNACSIIRDGFAGGGEKGILTTATSGRAHEEKVEAAAAASEGKRAMLVCRVIAGRVMKKKIGVGVGVGLMDELLYDSVAGDNVGLYSNLDELYVFNPMAILPCFVVIYGGF